MEKYLLNLRELFSEDKKIIYKALLEKKDWINKSFYVVGNLSTNEDLEDIFDNRVRFKRLYINPELKKDIQDEELKQVEDFRVLYLFDNPPEIVSNDEFVIKYDFSYLLDREYKMLFANFYPCLNKEEILQKEEDRFVQIMKLFMSKDLGDNVILMNSQELTSSCFYCKVIKEIQVNSNLLEGYLIQLRLTCQKLNIPLVEVK